MRKTNMFLHKQRKILKVANFSVKNLSTVLALGVGSELSAACVVYLQSLLFVELFTERDIMSVSVLLGFMLLNYLLAPFLALLRSSAQSRAGRVFKSNLRVAFMQEIIHLGPIRLEQMRLGKVQAMMTDGVESLEPYFIKYQSQVFITALSALVLFIAIALVDLSIAIVLLIFGLAVVAIPRIWDKSMGEKGHEHWSAYAKMNEQFIDNMAGITTLKAFGAGKRRKAELNQSGKTLLDSTLAQLRLGLGESGLSAAASALGPVVALGMVAYGFEQGTIELWELFVIIMLSRHFFKPFAAISSLWHESFFGISAMGSIANFFEDNRVKSDNTTIETPSGNIRFSNVSYMYPSSEKHALQNVSLNITQGKTVAIVGHSGSGKSTWLSLLMGFDRPSEGDIFIGNTNASNINLSKSICLVPQDAIIFQGTVREILQLANPNADEKALLEVLGIACALDLGQTESHPLDFFVEPKGANLSGGQRQRLAIARALIRNTPILLLDEATSALDSQTEHKILDGIKHARPRLTLVMVTHRKEIAKNADMSFTFKQGQLEES